jgi:hypothetical protein
MDGFLRRYSSILGEVYFQRCPFVTAHRVSAMKKGSIRALPLEETLEGVYKHRVGTLFTEVIENE